MSQNPATVNIYMIDQETKRKILFRVNPLMLGKPENTTILLPNGIEYKLVETEPSDAVKITKFYEHFEIISKNAAEHFPDFGYPDKQNPPREDLIKAITEETDKFIAFFKEAMMKSEGNLPSEEEINLFNQFIDIEKTEESKPMFDDIGFQKLYQWVVNNRTMVHAKKLMEERQLDPCYPKDYILRFTNVFKETVEQLEQEKPEMTFMTVIQKLSMIVQDMQNDFRIHSGQGYIGEVIHFYEPVQVMFQSSCITLSSLFKDGIHIKLNELYPGDKDKNYAPITEEFWAAFKSAMKSAYEAILKKKNEYETLVNGTMEKFHGPTKEFHIHVLHEIRELFDGYRAAYKQYNMQMTQISEGTSNENAEEVSENMNRNVMKNLLEVLDQINLEVVSAYSGDEAAMKEEPITGYFMTVTTGIPLVFQHNQNGTRIFSDINKLIDDLYNQLEQVEPIISA